MKVLLTGGAGDLGRLLARDLDERGDLPIIFDVRPPPAPRGITFTGSILDRPLLSQAMTGVDCVVHIAAWHGVHDFRKQKDVYDFWELNVTGTFYVFEAAARAGVSNIIYISSSDAEDRTTIYGHTKVLGEEIARTYAARHHMNVVALRPRAFIPYWNRDVYNSFIEWANWFWGGAVHIDDVLQGVLKTIDLLARQTLTHPLTLNLDGAYEYTDEDLAHWDSSGATFRKYYAPYEKLVLAHGLDPARKPTRLPITETADWLGYAPRYSLRNLLHELEQYGESGPPPPRF